MFPVFREMFLFFLIFLIFLIFCSRKSEKSGETFLDHNDPNTQYDREHVLYHTYSSVMLLHVVHGKYSSMMRMCTKRDIRKVVSV